MFKTDGGEQSNMTVVYNRYGGEQSNMTVVYQQIWGEQSNMTIVYNRMGVNNLIWLLYTTDMGWTI